MDQKWKISGKDILGYLLLGISVIMLGRSLMLCFSNDIWYDELFTVGMIEHSYGELIGFTARDVHPPLYYMITKFVVDLCKLLLSGAGTVAVVKMVSVLPYFILFLYSVVFIRKRFGIYTGGVFLFCSVAMPQLSGYTVEMRMYSWALLFVTAALLHGHGTVSSYVPGDRRKTAGMQRLHGAALVCYGVAAAYTQYFACVAVIMVYLYVLLVFVRRDRGRITEWLCWVAVSVCAYVPWLFILYRQITAVKSGYWILPLSWRTLGGCVKFLMKPAFTNDILNTVLAVVLSIVYGGVVLYNLIRFRRGRRAGQGSLVKDSPVMLMAAGIGVLAGLVLFGFAASVLVRPVFVYRYMVPAMGCFWLSFALGLGNMRGADFVDGDAGTAFYRIGGRLSGVIVLFIMMIGLRDYRAFMGEEEYKILLMGQTKEALSSIAPDDIVLYNFNQVQAVTSYYLPEDTGSYLWCGTPEPLIQDIVRPYGTLEDAAVLRSWCEDGRTVWFIGSFNSRDAVVEEWEAEGLQVEETGSYLLERYWFNLYKISV